VRASGALPCAPAGPRGDTAPKPHRGADISTLEWVLVGAAAWLAVALFLGVLIGRMIRHRDEQVPSADDRLAGPGEPGPTERAAGREQRQPGAAGRDRPRRR
jgi:hypothetical protein